MTELLRSTKRNTGGHNGQIHADAALAADHHPGNPARATLGKAENGNPTRERGTAGNGDRQSSAN